MWRTPEELVEIGFRRSRVVMMNEAHDGMMRSLRTRKIGRRILLNAHQSGVRYLAMEALYPSSVAEESNHTRRLPEKTDDGYLNQPEMRAFVQAALDLGWTLIAYEADMKQAPNKDPFSLEATNWREEMQAHNLVTALHAIPLDAHLLVWCGNGHLEKDLPHSTKIVCAGQLVPKPADEPDWPPIPMGHWLKHLSRLDPFTIDQTVTVNFPSMHAVQRRLQWPDGWLSELEQRGGTAGFLKEELPPPLSSWAQRSANAILLSIDNEME